MRDYVAFYRGKRVELKANSSYEAQQTAAKLLKAKKSYDVAIVLADVPVNTASL